MAIEHGYDFGYGYGSGSGYEYGNGYGYGDGFGYGDGDGYSDYWKGSVTMPDTKERLAYWWSDEAGQPSNGGGQTLEPAAPGVIHEIETDTLELCGPNALHATEIPPKWAGDRLWVVKLHGEVIGDSVKLGCRKREILFEIEL